ncbi:MAG: US12 family protein [Pirellulales bacterium]|nr:US12 family protein [Pirellulales bacterium]
MSYGDSQFSADSWGMTAEQASANERVDFIKKTYLHLFGAVLLFCGLEVVYFQTGIAENLFSMLFSNGRVTWLVVLAAFMAIGWLADYWAKSSTSVAMQYAGLGLSVAAWSVMFAPLLLLADQFGNDVIPTAGVITLLAFGGLTAAVFITGHDFSFLRVGLMFGGFAAMAAIACAMLFGFQLGNLFVIAMIVLSCGYILYDTSNVLHYYRIGQHVAAALALFASLALLFWYILQLVMSSRR